MATLDPLRVEVRRKAEAAVKQAAEQMQTRLKVTSPHDSFRMREATTVVARGLTAHARAAVDYASFVSEGTRPHKIPKTPKTGRSRLRFKPKGSTRYVYARQVDHPGTTANTWWDVALAKWHGFLEEGFR